MLQNPADGGQRGVVAEQKQGLRHRGVAAAGSDHADDVSRPCVLRECGGGRVLAGVQHEIDIEPTACGIQRPDRVDPHGKRIVARRPDDQAVSAHRRPNQPAARRRQQQPHVQAAMAKSAEILAGEAQALHMRRYPRRRHHHDLAEEDRSTGVAAVALPMDALGRAEMFGDMAGDRHLHRTGRFRLSPRRGSARFHHRA